MNFHKDTDMDMGMDIDMDYIGVHVSVFVARVGSIPMTLFVSAPVFMYYGQEITFNI